MSAAVYLKVSTPESRIHVTLVCAKSKIAPLKRLTIPRLELSAAVLLARLTSYVQKTLNLADAPMYLWIDSSVTLTWISSHPSRWKDFVQNRVISIQDLVSQGQWRFVPGKENPADCVSRGLTSVQLAHHHLWWNDPYWLKQSAAHWLTITPLAAASADLEEWPGLLTVSAMTVPPIWEQFSRYSIHTLLRRITAVCLRVCAMLKRIPQSSLATPLAPGNLENSRGYWVRALQSDYFNSELRTLSSGSLLPRTHPLLKLIAFVDRQGILRVGGRLKHAQPYPEGKNRAILPRDSLLTRLIIADAYLRTLHGGTQLTLATILRTY